MVSPNSYAIISPSHMSKRTLLSARGAGLFCALALLAAATTLFGQETTAMEVKTAGARIQADKLEQNGNQVSARGRVRVFYKDLILLADHVELNTETKDALAEGNVSLRLPNEVITAGLMMVNLDTALGSFEGAFGLVQPSLYFSSERMERESEEIFKMGRSRFTACSQAVPRWSITCARASMKKDDYVEMWGATFSVKKIPVFYLPYMKYPLAQERNTGFLFPQIGFSGVKGFSLSQSFYWAIAPNQDATFNVDYYGAKGVGGGIEYRYLFGSPDRSGAAGLFGGEARVYYFAFRTEEDGTQRENAYLLRWNHNQTLPGGFVLTAAVNYQTSFDFLREFDNNFKRALTFNRSSQVYLTRTWGGLSFSARASRMETHFQGFNNAIVSQSLPQVSLSLARTKILGPLGFSMSASYNNWQYGWQSQFDTGTPLKNQTVYLFPTLSVPFTAIPWLTVNASLSGNLQYFFRKQGPDHQRHCRRPLSRLELCPGIQRRRPRLLSDLQFRQARSRRDGPTQAEAPDRALCDLPLRTALGQPRAHRLAAALYAGPLHHLRLDQPVLFKDDGPGHGSPDLGHQSVLLRDPLRK